MISMVVAGAVFVTALALFTPVYLLIAKPLIKADPPRKAQGIVVLSGGLQPDGGLATSTAERVAYGIQLYKEGYAPTMVMSGGGPFRKRPDAQVMADEAVRQGVPRQAILTEDQSETTWENAVLTAKLLRDHGMSGVLLVTSPYHSFRSRTMFAARGVAVTSMPVTRSGFYEARGFGRVRYLRLMGLEYAKLVYFWLGRIR